MSDRRGLRKQGYKSQNKIEKKNKLQSHIRSKQVIKPHNWKDRNVVKRLKEMTLNKRENINRAATLELQLMVS